MRAAADRLRQLETENAARSQDVLVEIPTELRRAAALAGRSTKGGQIALNRFKARVRHFFNWAIPQGYRDNTPFKRHGFNVIRLNSHVGTERTRRLPADDEHGQARAFLAAEARLLPHTIPTFARSAARRQIE